MKNKRLFITVLGTILLALLIVGGTYAFWVWESSRNTDTNVAFTTQGKNFSCSADGGGNITSSDVLLQPTSCTDTDHAIVREIHTTVTNNTSDSLRLDLWLNINSIDTELANSSNLKWALTTSNEGCTAGTVIGSGNFKNVGNQVVISRKIYSASTTNTYYLYIWLDEAETDANTIDKSFSLSLGGTCTDDNIIEKPYINNSGLIPVRLSDTGDKVYTISEDDSNWYNYYEKKWANAILVSEDTNTRQYYKNNPGIEIPSSDILAYYVWIPRYSYKIWQYSGLSANGEEHEIDIRFVSKNIKEIANQNGEYYTHPAFTFGDKELTGIWVGKFEPSHITLSSSTTRNNLGCTDENCTNADGIRILPNVASVRYNFIPQCFYASRSLGRDGNPFGIDSTKINSHQVKDVEWSAASYLAISRYGINANVRTNNQSGHITGCGALYAGDAADATCRNSYGSQTNYPQSTTGNVTGIFDMSGNSWEYVMANVNKNLGIGTDKFAQWPEDKYYDLYPNPPFVGSGNSLDRCTFEYCAGHALTEIRGWYGASTNIPAYYPWTIKGGNLASGNIFSSGSNGNSGVGNELGHYSFRTILVEE